MWEQIRSNRIRSVVLVVVMAAILVGIGYFLGYAFMDNAVAGLFIALIVWVVLALIAYFQGDSILLSLSHAKKIKKEDHPRLFNVVEEMTIASGLPKMPDVYIIEDRAMNAFATGRDPEKASVAITSGLLEKLNRDELQGVIAHEIGHIKNRDVLLMSMCGVMLGTIVIMAWWVSRVLIFGGAGRSRRTSGGGGQAQAIIMIAGLVLMILAPILAQIIYYTISRKREYLADASSALYTRYPEGLASALEKLGSSPAKLETANNATAPMYIVNPFKTQSLKVADLTSTHPPLSERIRILRSMGGGASLVSYNQAFQKVHGGRGNVLGAATLAMAEPVGVRAASEPNKSAKESPVEKAERHREVADALERVNKYRTVTCECGTKWKIPPNFKDSQVLCTRCGRMMNVR